MQENISPGELRRRAAISRFNQEKYNSPENLKKRFWSKVDIRGTDECWPWIAWRNNKNYGCFRFGKKDTSSSRVAYILTFGEIPDNLEVCHKCDNPPCCNPSHLFTGTHLENMQDSKRKGRNSTARGEKSAKHKLSSIQVLEIRRLYFGGVYHTVQLSRIYGVGPTAIASILKWKSWKHLKSFEDVSCHFPLTESRLKFVPCLGNDRTVQKEA